MQFVFLLGHSYAEPQLADRQTLIVTAAAVGLLLAHWPKRDELQPTLAGVAVICYTLQDVVILLLFAGAFVRELREDGVVLIFDHLYRSVYGDLLPYRFYVLLCLLKSHALFGIHLHHFLK